MREVYRRNGDVVIFGDAGDSDELVAEPQIASFVPIPGNSHCVCGAPLERWSLRPVSGGGADLICHRCHQELGRFELVVRVHR